MNITITTVGISRCCAELIALRNVVVDGRECTVTLTRDNGITEYVAWEPLEGHSQMTKILSTELGAITSRPLPNWVPEGSTSPSFTDARNVAISAFHNECCDESYRVIDAAFPERRGSHEEGAIVERCAS
jgi:hypothetical protein